MDYKKIRMLTVESCDFIDVDSDKLIDVVLNKKTLLEERTGGPLTGKAFWLNNAYDWVIGKDDLKALVLIPLKRVKE